MHLSKKLVLSTIILAWGWAEQPSAFRGLGPAELSSRPLPLSYQSLIESSYNLTRGQVSFQRGTYLIISADVYAPYITPLKEFKASQGFDVQVRSLAEIGYTAPEIKQYIDSELSDNPLLEYVLFIGDVDGVGEVPSFYYGPENDVSDQSYSHLRGDDLIPDVFVGRFSVDSISELAVLISKTIHYHRDPLSANPDWLNRALVVAGNYSNTLPIPVTPKWTSYWVKEELELSGYSSVDTVFYPPVQQGATLIRASIDQGVGLVNYRGWGDANGWHYPEFHVGDVGTLNNGWMTPVFTSFVCNANDFANNVDPCLGESILRSGTPSAPKGGVAIIGPSDLHTSTKYNNIINAYMYDAMLDNGVRELAPAMLQGQLGLMTEFPQQDGPGEAQEKYFNVYNVLGDPSLNVFIGTPDRFTLTVAPVSANDGFVDIQVDNQAGNPVPGAVVAVINNGELLKKGITNAEGNVYFSLDTVVTSLDIYANHTGFIQGHAPVSVDASDQEILFVGYTLNSGEDKTVNPGDIVSLRPVLQNTTSGVIAAGTGAVSAILGGQIITANFQYPELSPGILTEATSPVEFQVAGLPFQGQVRFTIAVESGSAEGTLSVPVNRPALSLEPEFSLEGTVNDPSFRIRNSGSCRLTNVTLSLHSLSDSLTITGSSESAPFDIEPFSELSLILSGMTLTPGQVAAGSDLSYELELSRDTLVVFHHSANLSIPVGAETDPVAHNSYGYWMYDDWDLDYPQSPQFNWIELDPVYGGSGGIYHPLDDDDHFDLDLPFPFRYFGEDFSSVTVSSNGWISLIPCSVDYFWNYSIPMALGPRAQIAAFWDDLEVVGTDSIRVFTRYDETAGTFIIEWSRALNNFDEVTEETFEIILYSQTTFPTVTGDGVIDIQYLDINDVDVVKNYATIGIESPDQNDGTQVTFNHTYAPGAAPLENSRVYRFTTEAPQGFIPSLSTDVSPEIAAQFRIQPAYPNPFNPVTTIPVTLSNSLPVRARIYDITGRLVFDFGVLELKPGKSNLYWNGVNQSGHPVGSGTYFLRVSQNNEYRIQKLLLLK